MKRTVFTCDKCATEFEQATLSVVVPTAPLGIELGKRLGRPPVPALDFCGACSDELLRLIGEPHLSLRALEVERDDANAAAQRCLARVRELEQERRAYGPDGPPTEPPEGIADPLLDARATDVPPLGFAPADPLPEGFVLPPNAFAFSTEPPAVEPETLPASSPLAFAHGGAQ